MTREHQSAAGGVFIAISILLGVIAGAVDGQPTIGFLGGAGVGIAVALLLWVRDRRRLGH